MRPHPIASLVILVLISSLSGLRAEGTPSDWFYRAWQTEEGLPDNSISGLAQSPDGYLWIGTNGGPMRFNGRQFSPLPLRNIPELPSRQVRSMLMDRIGRLWLGLERGPLIRINEDSFRIFNEDDGPHIGKRIISMVDDLEGRVWVAFFRNIYVIDGEKVTRIESTQEIPAGSEATLACDKGGQVWLANNGKIGRLNDNGFELVRDFDSALLRVAASRDTGLWLSVGSDIMSMNRGDEITRVATLPQNAAVSVIFEDRSGAIWIGTQRAGCYRIENETVEKIATSHAWVECITEDLEGNIWAGTRGGGMNLIRQRTVEFFEKADGLPFSAIRSTCSDASGKLWAVSLDGRLAFKESGQWEIYRDLSDRELATCVTSDSEGHIWIGTRDHGLLKIDGGEQTRFHVSDGLASGFVRSLLTASNGDVWIATDEPSQLHQFRDGKILQIRHKEHFKAIRAMAEDSDGTVWVGTSDGLLLRVDGENLINESSIDGPLSRSIRTLHATPDGSLWIGYAGDGLGHLKNGCFRSITTEQGLHDNYISQIQNDEHSLWIAANRGLFQVSLEELLTISVDSESSTTLRCRVFGSSEGVPSIQPSRDYAPAACIGLHGYLYFPTHSGLLEVRADKIRENLQPPPVLLEKVVLDGQMVAAYKTRSMLSPEASSRLTDLSQTMPQIQLPADHDKMSISFAALSLTSPENVHFRYRLHPQDRNWQEVENQHSVVFPRLRAGEYQFQISACNSAGVWNETGAALSIIVHRFFWETWWFRIGGGLVTAFAAGGLVYVGLRRKHRLQLQAIAAKRALEQERSRIARDIHDDLGASLTRITLLSQSDTDSKSSSTIDVFEQIHTTARHLMRSMEEVVWAVNPEHDTFDALANYLSNYGQGFLSLAGVRCRLEMPLTLPERPLSAQIRHNLFLAFKEALNNAVKYAAATEVRITLELGSHEFVLRVVDNGRGIDPDASSDPMRPTSGSGLTNMKERLDEIGGSCVLHSNIGEGTSVEFKVPYTIKR